MAYVYKDASYIDDTGNRINCWLDLTEHDGWSPYTLDLADTDNTVDNAVLLSQMQEAGDVAAYSAPTPPTQAEIDAANAEVIRLQRQGRLTARVDPIVSNPMRWGSLSADDQSAVTAYRSSLLTITDQASFPTSVTWPTIPSVLDDL